MLISRCTDFRAPYAPAAQPVSPAPLQQIADGQHARNNECYENSTLATTWDILPETRDGAASGEHG
jgi:hypothetical protein